MNQQTSALAAAKASGDKLASFVSRFPSALNSTTDQRQAFAALMAAQFNAVARVGVSA